MADRRRWSWADLLILNQHDRAYDGAELRGLLRESDSPGIDQEPLLRVVWRQGSHRIEEIKLAPEDEEFNRGKGEVTIRKIDDDGKVWVIEVDRILAKAVLKLRIETKWPHHGYRARRRINRGLPFDMYLAGRKVE
jgi:hypothetical protein